MYLVGILNNTYLNRIVFHRLLYHSFIIQLGADRTGHIAEQLSEPGRLTNLYNRKA